MKLKNSKENEHFIFALQKTRKDAEQTGTWWRCLIKQSRDEEDQEDEQQHIGWLSRGRESPGV